MTTLTVTQNPPIPLNSIGGELKLFIRHIESLKEVMPTTMLALNATQRAANKNLEEFISKYQITDNSELPARLNFPEINLRKLLKVQSRCDNFSLASALVPRSIFVSLVSQYDAFLGRLLKSILNSRPELLNPSEKTISFTDALAFPSIEAMRDHAIEKEIEGLLRSSHLDHIKWMETRFDVPLTKGLELLPKFIELTERRNLFVHADGVISSNYLANCKKNGVSLDNTLKEGGQLFVSPQYFDESASCLLALGVKLAHVLWRKLLKEERKAADESLIETTYWLIDKEDYSSAIPILDFACNTIKNYSNNWIQSAFILNHAQAHKWAGNPTKCMEILDSYDWVALEDRLKLGNAALREDWTSCRAIMIQIGSNGIIKKHDYEVWPIFKEFRKTSEFLTAYQEIFSEPFLA